MLVSTKRINYWKSVFFGQDYAKKLRDSLNIALFAKEPKLVLHRKDYIHRYPYRTTVGEPHARLHHRVAMLASWK